MAALVLGTLLAMLATGAAAQPEPGDFVVTDFAAGTDGRGALFVVKPTGTRTLFSDFGDPAQGPVGRDPYAIARHPSGDFYVLDQLVGPGGALFKVDRLTGNRTLISDFGNATQGPLGGRPMSVAIDGGGQILVVDPFAHPPFATIGALLRVDAGTGARTVVSDFTNPAQGPTGERPLAVAFAGGEVLVTELSPDPVNSARLFRVDPGSGARTLVSDLREPSQGPTGFVPIAVAADSVPGQALVVEQIQGGGQPASGFGSLLSVNTGTGGRKMITDFTTPDQGPFGFNPSGAAVTANGDILVIDFDAGTNSLGGLFVVDRTSGRRCFLSDFGNPAQGPLGNEPSGFVIVPGGQLASGMAAAVLPTSRSVKVGDTATAFVTIVNAGCATARGVGITLSTAIPADFRYQTTDPLTNAPTGTPDTPVDIPIGGSQTFVIAITPTAAFPPTEVTFSFDGTNTPPVATLIGVNTLLLSASNTPVPDTVALIATLTGNGIIDIPGPAGIGVCAVATANVGAGGSITVSTNTGAAVLPVDILVCQTDPPTGVCITPLQVSVTLQIDAGATPTFAVFVTGSGFVPFDPAVNRLFVVFSDPGGIVRGSTSGALRTQ